MAKRTKPTPINREKFLNNLHEPYQIPEQIEQPYDNSDPNAKYRKPGEEEFIRANEISMKGDTNNTINISLEDHDEAIIYYLKNTIKPTVEINGIQREVPIIYGSPERWKSMQKDGFFRDKNGKAFIPIIAIKRESFEKDRRLGNKLDGNKAQNIQYFKTGYSKRNGYDNFSVLQNQKPSEEYQVGVIPDYITLTYTLSIFTDYVEHMNSIIEAIEFASDSYWGDKERFQFRASVTQFPTPTEVANGNDRAVKSDLTLTINGYIVPKSINVQKAAPTPKSFNTTKLIFKEYAQEPTSPQIDKDGNKIITYTDYANNNTAYYGTFNGNFIGDGSQLINLPTQSFNTGSFVLTGSFNNFTSSYTTGSFTGSFIGDGNGLINLNIPQPLPKDFYIAGEASGSQLLYLTDNYRTINISGSITEITNINEIVRNGNDLFITTNFYGDNTIISLLNCSIYNNELIIGEIIEQDITGISNIHGFIFYNGFLYGSDRTGSQSVKIIKINPYNLSDQKILTLPNTSEYIGTTDSIRGYGNNIYTLICTGTSTEASLVKIDLDLNNFSVIFKKGSLLTKRISSPYPFIIENGEIYIPWINRTSGVRDKMGIVVVDLNGNVLRESNDITLTSHATQRVLPHWMGIFNGKIILTSLYNRCLARIDKNTLLLEEVIPLNESITDDNTIMNDGWIYLNGEYNPSDLTALVNLLKVKYNDFTTLSIEISNYFNGQGSHGSLTQINLEEQNYFKSDNLLSTSSFYSFTSSYTTGSFTGSFYGNLYGTASYVDVTSSLGYIPENINNKVITLVSASNTTYPTSLLLSSSLTNFVNNFIPINGTTSGNPVTGEIQMSPYNNLPSIYVSGTTAIGGIFLDSTEVSFGIEGAESSYISVFEDSININLTDSSSRGITADQDFTANITDLDFVQKKYVDEAISGFGPSKQYVRGYYPSWPDYTGNIWVTWPNNTSNMLSTAPSWNVGAGAVPFWDSFNYIAIVGASKLTKMVFASSNSYISKNYEIIVQSFLLVDNVTAPGYMDQNVQTLIHQSFSSAPAGSIDLKELTIATHTLDPNTGIRIAFRYLSGPAYQQLGIQLLLEFE